MKKFTPLCRTYLKPSNYSSNALLECILLYKTFFLSKTTKKWFNNASFIDYPTILLVTRGLNMRSDFLFFSENLRQRNAYLTIQFVIINLQHLTGKYVTLYGC